MKSTRTLAPSQTYLRWMTTTALVLTLGACCDDETEITELDAKGYVLHPRTSQQSGTAARNILNPANISRLEDILHAHKNSGLKGQNAQRAHTLAELTLPSTTARYTSTPPGDGKLVQAFTLPLKEDNYPKPHDDDTTYKEAQPVYYDLIGSTENDPVYLDKKAEFTAMIVDKVDLTLRKNPQETTSLPNTPKPENYPTNLTVGAIDFKSGTLDIQDGAILTANSIKIHKDAALRGGKNLRLNAFLSPGTTDLFKLAQHRASDFDWLTRPAIIHLEGTLDEYDASSFTGFGGVGTPKLKPIGTEAKLGTYTAGDLELTSGSTLTIDNFALSKNATWNVNWDNTTEQPLIYLNKFQGIFTSWNIPINDSGTPNPDPEFTKEILNQTAKTSTKKYTASSRPGPKISLNLNSVDPKIELGHTLRLIDLAPSLTLDSDPSQKEIKSSDDGFEVLLHGIFMTTAQTMLMFTTPKSTFGGEFKVKTHFDFSLEIELTKLGLSQQTAQKLSLGATQLSKAVMDRKEGAAGYLIPMDIDTAVATLNTLTDASSWFHQTGLPSFAAVYTARMQGAWAGTTGLHQTSVGFTALNGAQVALTGHQKSHTGHTLAAHGTYQGAYVDVVSRPTQLGTNIGWMGKHLNTGLSYDYTNASGTRLTALGPVTLNDANLHRTSAYIGVNTSFDQLSAAPVELGARLAVDIHKLFPTHSYTIHHANYAVNSQALDRGIGLELNLKIPMNSGTLSFDYQGYAVNKQLKQSIAFNFNFNY